MSMPIAKSLGAARSRQFLNSIFSSRAASVSFGTSARSSFFSVPWVERFRINDWTKKNTDSEAKNLFKVQTISNCETDAFFTSSCLFHFSLGVCGNYIMSDFYHLIGTRQSSPTQTWSSTAICSQQRPWPNPRTRPMLNWMEGSNKNKRKRFNLSAVPVYLATQPITGECD